MVTCKKRKHRNINCFLALYNIMGIMLYKAKGIDAIENNSSGTIKKGHNK